MPVTIALRFPAGRFHATPWGHHVNEGLPEWPPSPWRLLRALVATWKRKLGREPLVGDHIEFVLAALAGEPPAFALPPATLGHTRHFMPLNSTDQSVRTKVFDAFVAISPDHPDPIKTAVLAEPPFDPLRDVVFHWPDSSLSDEQHQTLSRLLSQLGYFGRSESWCSARLLTAFDPNGINCRPGEVGAGEEAVRVLVPKPEEWRSWSFGPSRPRPEPAWNLLAETADLHAERWSDPPGSRWQTYARRANCFATRSFPRQPRAAEERTRFTVARFVVDVAEGRRPLPLLTEAVPFAEAVRKELLRTYGGLMRRRHGPGIHRSETLSGKDENGECLKSHGHAFYLATAEERDRTRIDHLTVYAPVGFTRDEVAALDHVSASAISRSLRFREADYRLLLTGLGTPADVKCRLFEVSDRWISEMPFVATRHLKSRGKKRDSRAFFDPEAMAVFLQTNLMENWEQRTDLRERSSTPPEVEPIFDPFDAGLMRFRPLQFHRGRSRVGDDGFSRPFGAFRLKFSVSVAGPFCLGYGSHFGLGLFLPDSSA